MDRILDIFHAIDVEPQRAAVDRKTFHFVKKELVPTEESIQGQDGEITQMLVIYRIKFTMIDQYHTPESDDSESRLDSAVHAVLAEPLPEDAVERVKTRAKELDTPTISPSKPEVRQRFWLVRAVSTAQHAPF